METKQIYPRFKVRSSKRSFSSQTSKMNVPDETKVGVST